MFQQNTGEGVPQRMHSTRGPCPEVNAGQSRVASNDVMQVGAGAKGFKWSVVADEEIGRFSFGSAVLEVVNDGPTDIIEDRIAYRLPCFVLDDLDTPLGRLHVIGLAIVIEV